MISVPSSSSSSSAPESEAAPVTTAALFAGFSEIALSSFGGALPWAQRVLVERRRWLAAREFAEILGLCQALPGGNVINVSVFVGTRFRGWRGALASLIGMLAGPFLIVLALAILTERAGRIAALDGALRGVGAAAAGMVLATGLKMLSASRRDGAALLFAGLAAAGAGVLRVPLPLLLLALVPAGAAVVGRRAR